MGFFCDDPVSCRHSVYIVVRLWSGAIFKKGGAFEILIDSCKFNLAGAEGRAELKIHIQ